MLTHPCPECTEGRVYRFGGNNPDGRSRRCDDCDGARKIPIRCEGYPCRAPAVRIVDGAPLCEACARETETIEEQRNAA